MTTSLPIHLFTAATIILLSCPQQYAESTTETARNQASELLQQSFSCPPWYVYHHEDSESCNLFRKCHEADQLPSELKCTDREGAQVEFGYCITYI